FCRDINREVKLIGNGDVRSITEATEKAEAYGFDGMMLGRAIFGNPWIFAGRSPEELTFTERLTSLRTLARYFDELRPKKHHAILKKHFKAFIQGFDGAADLRAKLMETENLEELEAVLNNAS